MQSDQTTPPKRIWADPPETFDGMDIWRSEPGGKGVPYILASEVAALIAEAEARGMERAAHVVRLHGNVARTKLRETYDAGDTRGNSLWSCIVGHLDIADDAILAEAAAIRAAKGETT